MTCIAHLAERKGCSMFYFFPGFTIYISSDHEMKLGRVDYTNIHRFNMKLFQGSAIKLTILSWCKIFLKSNKSHMGRKHKVASRLNNTRSLK